VWTVPIMGGMAPRSPLSALLSHALIAFDWEYQRAGNDDGSVPTLPLWSNLLRLVGEEGVELRELPRLARLSRRAVRPLVTGALHGGYLANDSPPCLRSGSRLRLTERGRRARELGRSVLLHAEAGWRECFGDQRVDALRASLEALVSRLELELPHYPLGYGPADNSMVGGRFVPEKLGPPHIPAHGQDWLPVLRRDVDTVNDLPLSALLSQVLVAFAIDYESQAAASLATSANVLRLIGDEGVPLDRLPPGADVTGSGRSGMERHGQIVVDRDPSNPIKKLAHLTPSARHIRDAYSPMTAESERRWEQRYGQEVVHALRAALESIVTEIDEDLPHFPAVAWIGGRFAEMRRPAAR
jgi:hypothetical protein